jgi:hypothetical protein
MSFRISPAVAAAAIAAMLLVPAPSSARGGAGMAGHGGGFHPPVRPLLVHRHDPLFVNRKFRERHPFEHLHHRRNDGIIVYGYGGYGYGGYGYGADGYAGNGYGENDYSENRYGDHGYRSETVPVPTPGGAERSVTITRC